MKLDSIDLKILSVLQDDGRITRARLGELVGLSPSPCHERVKRLEAAGYIRGYHAEIDLGRLCRPSFILVEICLESHAAADFDRFRRYVTGVPEILECFQTSGAVDFILKVVAPGIEAYQRLMDRLVEAEIGIGRFTTCVVTKTVKQGQSYPLNILMPGQD